MYLTSAHREDRGRGCLFAALGPEIVRQPKAVRRAVTEGFRRTVNLQTIMTARAEAARRRQALATMAGLVGALILSRMVDDIALSDEILNAAAAVFSHSRDV